MQKLERCRLWSTVALALGLVSVPVSSQGTVLEDGKAIDRLPEIRAALRVALEEGKESNRLSGLGKLMAQWGNWPNWSNWGNG